MPTYVYQAMNSSGQEVKDEIEATTQDEAIAKIRNKGQFATKIKEKAAKKKVMKKDADLHRRRAPKATRQLYPPALHPSGCRPPHPPLAPDSRTTAEARLAQS